MHTSRRAVMAGLAATGLSAAGLAARAEAAVDNRLTFDGLYKSAGVLGMQFSDKVAALDGRDVVMRGFMAPPLKAEADFFVLTRQPVSLCPFCNSDADWPADIVVVYLGSDQAFVQNNVPIEVEGQLGVGSYTDPHSGFVSLLRIVDAHYRTL